MKLSDFQQQVTNAQRDGIVCLASALIVDERARIFVQKRSAARKLFPNCWDIIGGHIEDNETLEDSLVREIREETGWRFDKLLDFVGAYDSVIEDKNYREFVFIVRVDGNLGRPHLETEKVTEARWITEADLDILLESRPAGDHYIYNIVSDGFEMLNAS